MTQSTFSLTVPPATNSLALLDANFTEVYRVANLFSVPSFAGASPKVYIDSGGNVGIGAATPFFRLDVQAASATVGRFQNPTVAATSEISIASNDRALAIGQRSSTNVSGDLAYIYQATATPIGLFTNGAERMRVDSAGSVLIGRTSQAGGGKLEVSGNLVLQPAASAPTLTVNGDMSFQLVSNTSLKILVRGSDGTTRSVTLTLA